MVELTLAILSVFAFLALAFSRSALEDFIGVARLVLVLLPLARGVTGRPALSFRRATRCLRALIEQSLNFKSNSQHWIHGFVERKLNTKFCDVDIVQGNVGNEIRTLAHEECRGLPIDIGSGGDDGDKELFKPSDQFLKILRSIGDIDLTQSKGTGSWESTLQGLSSPLKPLPRSAHD